MILPSQKQPDFQNLETGEELSALLRSARREAGISVEQLAQTTRIASRFLQNMEEGSFGSLPAPVFVRGYLKAISKELKTDLEPLIAAYEDGIAKNPKEPSLKVQPIEPSRPNVSFKTGHVLAVLLAILGFFLIYFAVEGGPANTNNGTINSGQSTVVTPDTRPIHPR